MEKQANADSTDDLSNKDSNNDQINNPIKVELSDIVLPATSPSISSLNPSLNNGLVATPYVNQPRENPQKRKNSPPLEIVSKRLCQSLYEINDDSSTDTEEYTITIKDDGKKFQLGNYIEEGELLGDAVIKRDESNEVTLKFDNLEDYHKVSNRIKTRKNNPSSNSPMQEDLPDNGSDSAEVLQQSCCNSTDDVEYREPPELYGLQLEFLKSLDITPPLDQCVHVIIYFRCDKTELRKVMELAGCVLSCSVIPTKRYAKVQYSHPLEAVQAVLMLNGQTFNGQKLSVYIESNPINDIILPNGFANFGIGLGISGRPIIRDIVSQYENFIMAYDDSHPGPSYLTHGHAPNQGPSNLAHGPGPNQGPMQGTGLPQLSVPPQLHNNANLSSIPVSGSVSGLTSIGHPQTKVDVEFEHLPPSTTFPLFCEKLSQFGQVTCLMLTTPGCAIASFTHPAHAERCYQYYDGMVIEGFRIGVELV